MPKTISKNKQKRMLTGAPEKKNLTNYCDNDISCQESKENKDKIKDKKKDKVSEEKLNTDDIVKIYEGQTIIAFTTKEKAQFLLGSKFASKNNLGLFLIGKQLYDKEIIKNVIPNKCFVCGYDINGGLPTTTLCDHIKYDFDFPEEKPDIILHPLIPHSFTDKYPKDTVTPEILILRQLLICSRHLTPKNKDFIIKYFVNKYKLTVDKKLLNLKNAANLILKYVKGKIYLKNVSGAEIKYETAVRSLDKDKIYTSRLKDLQKLSDDPITDGDVPKIANQCEYNGLGDFATLEDFVLDKYKNNIKNFEHLCIREFIKEFKPKYIPELFYTLYNFSYDTDINKQDELENEQINDHEGDYEGDYEKI